MTDEPDIATLEQMFTALEKKKQESDSRAHELKMRITEIERAFRELSNEETALRRERSVEEQGLRELEKQISTAKRLEMLRTEQEQLKAEFEEKAKQLDALTATAKWREFAFDHQIQGAKVLGVAKRGILADKRGLGKTLTSLVWADMVGAKKVLVIAPNDVVPQFEGEIREWAPSRFIMSLRGMPKAQRDIAMNMVKMLPEYIITLNYEAWRRDKTLIDDLVAAGIDTIICDEAHRIKSAEKLTARGVFQIAYRPNFCESCNSVASSLGPWLDPNKGIIVDKYDGDCLKCGRELTSSVANVLCMTGTPILNKPQELFSLLFLVNKRIFPSQRKFESDYCYEYAPNKWKFMTGGLEKLTKQMSQFFLQRNRDDAGIKVPPPAITVHEIIKDPIKYAKQYDAERQIAERAQLLIDGGQVRKDFFFLFEILLRRRQVMVWPAGMHFVIKDDETQEILYEFDCDVEESQKIDEIEEFMNELIEEEERVIVFSQFKAPLYELQRRLVAKGVSVAMATGDQTDRQKEQVRNDFDLKTAPEKPRYQICLATYKAFGTGINLNAARHVVIVDDEWNPGMEDQAIGRIDRMNSVDQANVHIFRVKDSADDFMAGLLELKRGIVDGFETSSIEKSMYNFLINGEGL
jgi:SNF2 family DNA or RNA helicase